MGTFVRRCHRSIQHAQCKYRMAYRRTTYISHTSFACYLGTFIWGSAVGALRFSLFLFPALLSLSLSRGV